MWFLAFDLFKPSTWLSEASDGVMGAIISALRTMLFNITEVVYKLIVLIYSLFDRLCNARLLSNEILNTMSNRIGLLLGLIMFFYVVFSLIQMLIDPEKITDKENGALSVVKKTILVIFMLGISNFGFETLYDIQTTIVKSDVISRLILPYAVKSEDKENFGNFLSFQLMKAFYQVDETNSSIIIDTYETNKFNTCRTLTDAFFSQIYADNKYYIGYMCLNESVKTAGSNGIDDEIYIIDFNGLFAIAAGLFVIWILLMYCFKVGVRMVQLAVLEVISPMAIVSHLSPKKDTMLSRWWKVYFSTYIDVFIRIAIINFVIFLICALFSNNEHFIFWDSLEYVSLNDGEKGFFSLVIILALLTFAKKAPELIKELLPNAGKGLGFGLGMKDIWGLEKVGKAATGIVGGALGGAAIGILSGSVGGFAGGLLKGGLSGLKGQGFSKTAASAWKSNKDSIKKMRDIRANGGSWMGSHLNRLQQNLGMRTAYENTEKLIADLQAEADLYNTASKEAEGEAIKNASNYIGFSNTAGRTLTLRELEKLSNDQTIDSRLRASYQDEYSALLKAATTFNLDYGLAVENGQVEFSSAGDFVSLLDSSGGVHTTYADIDGISNKDELIGNKNITIDANMSKLVGKAGSGRGKRGKTIRNNNQGEITKIKLSKQYKRNKANNGK